MHRLSCAASIMQAMSQARVVPDSHRQLLEHRQDDPVASLCSPDHVHHPMLPPVAPPGTSDLEQFGGLHARRLASALVS